MTYDYTTTVEFPEEAIEWMATWHCYLDACPKCQNLNGYPFYGQGNIPDYLEHPQWGPVWDIRNNMSLTHPNCRCDVEAYISILPSKIPIVQEFDQSIDLSELEVEVRMLDVPAISELQTKLDSLKGTFNEATESMRAYVVMSRMLGLPPDITQGIMQVSRLKNVYSILGQGGGMSMGEAGIVIAAEYFALRYGSELLTTLYGANEQQIKERLEGYWKRQQHDLEVFQMNLRRQHF